MKILLVCNDTNGRNGWSRYSQILKQTLEKAGHTVSVCCAKDMQGDWPLLPSPLRMLSRPYLTWLVARDIHRIMKREHIDILHITVEPYALACAILPKSIVDKTVLTIHGNYGIRPLKWWMTRILAKRYYRRIARFITVSRYTKNAVGEALRQMKEEGIAENVEQRTSVIMNRIHLPEWKVPKPRLHHVLFVGTVRSSKGVLEALEGCATYWRRYGNAIELTIIGDTNVDPDYVCMLRKRAEQLHMQNNLHILGTVEEDALQATYRSAAAFIMPSVFEEQTFEGYGIVYIEANAFGIPVIGPKKGGPAEAIREGQTGYRIDPQHPDMIADRLHWILDQKRIDPVLCRQWAEKHDAASLQNELNFLYAQVLRP